WQEFWESNQFLHAPLFALAFAVVISALIVLCRIVIHALRRARSAKPLVLIAGGLVACAGLGLCLFGLRSGEAVFLPFGASFPLARLARSGTGPAARIGWRWGVRRIGAFWVSIKAPPNQPLVRHEVADVTAVLQGAC